MAFKMKGSAFKLNEVATKSALKQGWRPPTPPIREEDHPHSDHHREERPDPRPPGPGPHEPGPNFGEGSAVPMKSPLEHDPNKGVSKRAMEKNKNTMAVKQGNMHVDRHAKGETHDKDQNWTRKEEMESGPQMKSPLEDKKGKDHKDKHPHPGTVTEEHIHPSRKPHSGRGTWTSETSHTLGPKMKSPLEQNKEKFTKTEPKAKASDVQPKPVKKSTPDPQGPTDPSEFTFAMKSPLEQSYWEQLKKGAGDLYDEASQIGEGTAAWFKELGRDQGGGYGRQKTMLTDAKEAYSAEELRDAVAKGDYSNVSEEDMRRAKRNLSPEEFTKLKNQKYKDRRSKMTPAERVAEDKQIEAETERKRLEQARLEAEELKRADEEWEKM